uniref:Uncharacterized protein n=1 Tax=Rhizophora mucronata TaxID=61149 RepID=A0A2P2NDL6_RHIMU
MIGQPLPRGEEGCEQ